MVFGMLLLRRRRFQGAADSDAQTRIDSYSDADICQLHLLTDRAVSALTRMKASAF